MQHEAFAGVGQHQQVSVVYEDAGQPSRSGNLGQRAAGQPQKIQVVLRVEQDEVILEHPQPAGGELQLLGGDDETGVWLDQGQSIKAYRGDPLSVGNGKATPGAVPGVFTGVDVLNPEHVTSNPGQKLGWSAGGARDREGRRRERLPRDRQHRAHRLAPDHLVSGKVDQEGLLGLEDAVSHRTLVDQYAFVEHLPGEQ
ncbi:MAG: hypothetical protein CVU59_10610, partial [Deltaproteobacteria bacterium HGW-Deltaproteobacteria-17]